MEHIKEDFKKVIAYSQYGIDNPKIDFLFEQWRNAKDKYIRQWGGYTYTAGKFQFELSEEAKEENFNNFLYKLHRKYYNIYGLTDFLRVEGYKSFYKNIVEKTYTSPNSGITIPNGTKLIKSFKMFVNNPEMLRCIQDEASLEIQKNKLEGTLCFSVHPLDFLSSSENTYNWRSCHALDGEYRSGNLSYMVDETTIVCYIKGDNDAVLPHFPEDVLWNNKKWRMLLFTTARDNLLFAGKQYPFEVNNVLDTIKEQYLISMKKEYVISSFSSWHNDYAKPKIEYENGKDCSENDTIVPNLYYFINQGIYRKTTIIKDEKGSYHFNDLLNSSTYVPYYCWQKEYGAPVYKLKIGGTTKCLRCGEDEICGTDTMMCKTCELEYGNSEGDDFVFCEICGERMLTEEAVYCSGLGYVCEDCYHAQCTQCYNCGEIILTSRAIEYEGETYCIYCHPENRITNSNIESIETLVNPIAERVEQLFFNTEF